MLLFSLYKTTVIRDNVGEQTYANDGAHNSHQLNKNYIIASTYIKNNTTNKESYEGYNKSPVFWQILYIDISKIIKVIFEKEIKEKA